MNRFALFSLMIILKALLIGPFCFAQTDGNPDDHQFEKKDEKQLEELMDNFQKDQQQVLKVFEGMDSKSRDELMKKVQAGDPAALQETMKAMMKGEDGKLSAKKIRELTTASLSSFREMSHSDLKEQLAANAQGTMLEGALSKEGKTNEFLARSLRDNRALPEFFRIIENRNKLFIFLGVSIFSMVLGRFLKRKDIKNDVPFLYSMVKRMTILYSIRIGALVYLFGQELGPIATIFKDVYLKNLLG